MDYPSSPSIELTLQADRRYVLKQHGTRDHGVHYGTWQVVTPGLRDPSVLVLDGGKDFYDVVFGEQREIELRSRTSNDVLINA